MQLNLVKWTMTLRTAKLKIRKLENDFMIPFLNSLHFS